MSIVAASQQETVLGAALAYAELGMSVLPIIGKLSPIKWTPHQTRRASLQQIEYWARRGFMQSVGIVTGAVSGNLAVMDLDGLQSVSKFEFEFPELLDTYTVLSGSGAGKHIYWYVDCLPPTTKTAGFELRCDEMYVVAPPSIHNKSGKPYTVINPVEIKRLPHLDQVVGFIESLKEDLRQDKEAQRAAGTPPLPAINNAYGLTALDRECRNVSMATARVNDQLNLSAFKLGQLVALGHLSESTVESELLKAAAHLSARDGEALSVKTIRSGLNAGKNKMDRSRGALK